MTGSGADRGTKWAEVDIGALRDNTAALRGGVGPSCAVMAMVKANGYGHGAVAAARAALDGGATWLGVSSIPEAVELRDAGVAAPILNVGWTMPAEMNTALDAGVDITVFDVAAVSAARAAARAAAAAERPLRVHWKLDTGMGRQGTPAQLVDAMREALVEAGPRVEVAGIFTHFASADDASTDFATAQHARFLETVARAGDSFPRALLHCANSAAMLRLPDTHHDMVRLGIALYGYTPPHCEGIVELRPALQVKARVTQVKDVEAGSSVGYGREWVAQRRTRVATVAAGYADGVDRRNGTRGSVILGGTICPMIGRVSMDQLTVDVSAVGEVAPGDTAILIGASGEHAIDARTVADAIGTIPNEVLCAVSARVPRLLVGVGEETT